MKAGKETPLYGNDTLPFTFGCLTDQNKTIGRSFVIYQQS